MYRPLFFFFLVAVVLIQVLAVKAARIRRLTAPSPPAYVECGIGMMDMTALARGTTISTSNWENINIYWQPCGLIKTPTQCQEGSSGVCLVDTFQNTTVSIGDWSPHGNVTWSSSITQNMPASKPSEFTSGATVSFQSASPNCKNMVSGKNEFYRTSITLLCDMSGTYTLHGPLVVESDSEAPCFWSMSMRTPMACPRDMQALA